MGNRYYGAYGSNLNIQQMHNRCPGSVIMGTAELSGYELTYRKSVTGSYLTVDRKEDGVVPLGIWEITEEDELELDRYEGVVLDLYYKQYVEVMVYSTKGEPLGVYPVLIYVMNENRPYGLPRENYIDTCKEGYGDFEFDVKILNNAYTRTEKLIESYSK